MRVVNVSDPVYAPNSKGGPRADTEHYQPVGWYTDGDMVRSAYTLHERGRRLGSGRHAGPRGPGRRGPRARLVSNVVGHLLNGVTEPVLQRAFEYWRNVDKELGDKIEAGVRAKAGDKDPKAAGQANPARESMQAKA